MKKVLSAFILVCLSSLLSANITADFTGIYDSFGGPFFGVEATISAGFFDDTHLNTEIDYHYEGRHCISSTIDYSLNLFSLGGGLNFTVESDSVVPGLRMNAGFKLADFLKLNIYGTTELNSANVFSPKMFELGGKVSVKFQYIAVNSDFYFIRENPEEYTLNRASATLSTIVFKEGFLYSMKAGLCADYTNDSRNAGEDSKSLVIKGIIGFGKNKTSGTTAIQATFSLFPLMGPAQPGVSLALCIFPGRTSYSF